YTRRSLYKKSIRKWIIFLLVFWGLFKILFYLLSDVIFQFIDIPKPYELPIQMTASGLIILLSLIFTSLLVNERNSYEEL
ncbi:MAG TPA: hypothetical protein VGN02_13620, partial [Paenibacillus sp.]